MGSWRRIREKSVTPKGASAIAVPEWPDFALAGASMASEIISRMALSSRFVDPGYVTSGIDSSVVNEETNQRQYAH